MIAISQDKALELRYSRGADFNDPVAQEYLERLPTPDEIRTVLIDRDLSHFMRPFIDTP